MKHTLLLLLAVVAACSEPPCEEPGHPVDDAGVPVALDAMPGPSDINPPLTPDDPCRQLKAEVPGDIYWASAGRQADLLVVAYATAQGVHTLAYQDDVLLNQSMIGASPSSGTPAMFYVRDSLRLMVATGTSTMGSSALYQFNGDGDPMFVEQIPNVIPYGVAWERSSDDDAMFAVHGAVVGDSTVGHLFVNVDRGFMSTGGRAGAWWSHRIGDEGILRVFFLDTPIGSSGPVETIIETADFGPASGFVQFGPAQTGITEATVQWAVAMEEGAVGAFVTDALGWSYYVVNMSGGNLGKHQIAGLRISKPARVGDFAYAVEHLLAPDGLTGRWVVGQYSRNGRERTVGFAREGKAGVEYNGHFDALRVENSLMWAGPTIADDGPTIAPADHIAVCEMSM